MRRRRGVERPSTPTREGGEASRAGNNGPTACSGDLRSLPRPFLFQGYRPRPGALRQSQGLGQTLQREEGPMKAEAKPGWVSHVGRRKGALGREEVTNRPN